MTEAPLESIHSDAKLPTPREDINAATGRLMIVAEAKLLVQQLDAYLEMLDELEEEAIADAEQ